MVSRKFFHILKIDTLEPKVRRILWLPLVFAALSLVALAVLVPTYSLRPNWQSLIVLISNVFVLGLNLVSFLLFRRKRVTQGTWLILLTTWWNLALSGVFYQGLGIILSISVIFLTLLVVILVFAGRARIWAILMGGVVAYAIFGFDVLTSVPMPWRISTFSTQLAYPIMGGMLLMAAIVLAFQFRKFSMTGKLITSFLGITLVVAVLLAVMTQYVSQGRLSELIGNQLRSNAENHGLIIGDDLNRQLGLLKALSLERELLRAIDDANAGYTGSQADIQAHINRLDEEWKSAPDVTTPLIWERLNHPVASVLRNFRALFPDHVEVFITDQYGGIVATSNRTSDYNQGDEGWWQSAYNGGVGAAYIGVPELDESTQTFAVNMAIPVRNDNNQVIGVLRTTYNVRAIVNLVNTSKMGKTGEIDLVIPGDKSVSGSATTVFNQGETEPASQEVLDIMKSMEKKTYLQHTYEGQMDLLSQGLVHSVDDNPEISALNWRALAQQSSEEAFAPVQSQIRVSLMVIYLLVAVMAVVGYAVSLLLTRPIVHLTRVAEQVSAGDLTVRARVESSDKEHPNDEIGVLAKTFNNMTDQLNNMVGTLEQRVADRTRAIVTSTEVSRRLSTILNQQELVSQVVQQVQSAFNYYHAHIYLYDARHENLVMAGGTGEAGRTMLARGHQIVHGKGLVGRAAETNTAVLVGDTHQDASWLPNPLLPETQSEVAVPIAVGDTVLGVLDVQHNVVNGLTDDDVDLLQSISSQVAIALQNARSFAEAQRQGEREALVGTISQKIRQTTTVDEALQVTVRELGRVVGAPQTRVRLGLADRGE